MKSRAEVLDELRNMVRDIIAQATTGASQGRIAQARGYADGYMRALLDLEIATQRELLELVASERTRAFGPAVRSVELSAPQRDPATA
jgi:hypothetical protein